MAEKRWDRRKKGTLAGLALVAYGVVGAIVGYISDSNSLDYLRMGLAKDYALLHLVLWTIGGLLVIMYYNRPAEARRDALPFETRDERGDDRR